VVASTEYGNYLEQYESEYRRLPYSLHVNKVSGIQKLLDIWHRLLNIRKAFKQCNDEILWFVNIDWTLFLYLGICGKKTNKLIVTTYCDKDKFMRKFVGSIIARGLKEIDLIIATNPNLSFEEKSIFIPDFYYHDFYKKYEMLERSEDVLIIGTIRREKNVEQAFRVFKDNDLPLNIAGQFYEQKLYQQLRKDQVNKIKIRNERISDDEYYGLIGSAKYVMLPYNMKEYETTTSGVLLECMFLNAVPIAPTKLLEFNGVEGLGYNEMDEIPELLKKSVEPIINANKRKRTEYDYHTVQNKLIEAVSGL
jgi:glycosyltransferase involved in cell wall biosynthesis